MLHEAYGHDTWTQTRFDVYSALIQRLIRNTIEANCEGTFRGLILSHFEASGKMARSYVAYRLGLILQTPVELSAAWATTCELLHNATLVHDDLQDRDVLRRGRPTLWRQYGDAQAINAGDFLLMVASQPTLLCTAPAPLKMDLMLRFSQMACRIAGGQSLEFELNALENPEFAYERYFSCIARKTAALFSDLAVGVNILSDRSHIKNNDLEDLFSRIGILFQMQDDIIDLYGNKQRDGRGCDIKEGKVSILVATHLQNHPEDFALIKSILKKPRDLTTDDDIIKIEELFLRKGTLSACQGNVAQIQEQIFQLEIVRNSPPLQELVLDLSKAIMTPLSLEAHHANS